MNSQVQVSILRRLHQQHRTEQMMVRLRRADGNAGSADLDVSIGQNLAALALIIDGNLLAKLKADLRLVPARDLNSAIVLGCDPERLVWDGFALFIADRGAIAAVVRPQMVAAIVARRVIIHSNGRHMPVGLIIGARDPGAEWQDQSQNQKSLHGSPRSRRINTEKKNG